MVPSSTLIVSVDGERLSCDVFSLDETIHFGSLEFIANHFGGLRLFPMGDGSRAVVMGSTHGGTPFLLWAMIGDSVRDFHMASD
jgi:hypothetical protein